jgi:hypothetical protein
MVPLVVFELGSYDETAVRSFVLQLVPRYVRSITRLMPRAPGLDHETEMELGLNESFLKVADCGTLSGTVVVVVVAATVLEVVDEDK